MNKVLGTIVSMSLLATSSAALADTPRGVSDLVGARAAGGETQLESRGYVHIKTDKGDDRAWSYWWQPRDKLCLSVAVMDGRFDSITQTPAPDCNQSSSKSDGGDKAAAIAVGAAALIGVLALAHKSHNHEDGKHSADDAADAAFERGYRDGLYSQDYHNYDRSDDYSKGYSEGVSQRGRETEHRDYDGRGSAGYAPKVNLNDLLTARAAGAETQLSQRGFTNVNGYKANDTAYTFWYNRMTAQCVQVAVTDGRVRYISAIKEKACQ